jgi:pimeloyl-ACP methyl ester carboxylesterase
MGHQQSKLKESLFIYDSNNVGYIESMMNTLIFLPRNKEIFKVSYKPDWIKYITLPNSNKLSYFVIDPISNKSVNTLKSDKKYILWSHGNAGDLLSLYPVMKMLYQSMGGRIGIIVYDYEGYGYSNGECSEKNCYNDLACMVRHSLLTLNIRKKNIFLIGQSLGTGVVVDFCYRHHWKTPIILISPYKSISRVKIDPYWFDIISNIAIDNIDMFTTQYKLHYLKCNIIIYHGTRDQMIPVEHSIEMYNNHTDKIKLILLKNATHNDTLNYIRPLQLLNIIEQFSKSQFGGINE